MKKVCIFDTSVLCCWLKVQGKEECGPENDKWDHQRINTFIEEEERNGSTFVLPIATIIETGNHIAQSNGNRWNMANDFAQKISMSVNSESPWAAFDNQSEFWTPDKLASLADTWPTLAIQGIGIGDATIKDIAEYYALTRTVDVEILTGDAGLKAYQPPQLPQIGAPRRRRR